MQISIKVVNFFNIAGGQFFREHLVNFFNSVHNNNLTLPLHKIKLQIQLKQLME